MGMTNEPEDQAFGAKLRRARKAKGLSLETLAEQLTAAGFPITAQAISLWENGGSTNNRELVEALEELVGTEGELADALGLPGSPLLAERMNELAEDFAALRAEVDELTKLVSAVVEDERRRG